MGGFYASFLKGELRITSGEKHEIFKDVSQKEMRESLGFILSGIIDEWKQENAFVEYAPCCGTCENLWGYGDLIICKYMHVNKVRVLDGFNRYSVCNRYELKQPLKQLLKNR